MRWWIIGTAAVTYAVIALYGIIHALVTDRPVPCTETVDARTYEVECPTDPNDYYEPFP